MPYSRGLHELGDGCFAYLQPDGSWGWSNAGLIVGDGASVLVDTLFDLPLTELLFRAQGMHRRHQPHDAVQLATLLSIKTGSCPEDCGYCSQSARNKTGLESEALLSVDTVLEKARQAKELGASRFCMGAAWRSPKKDSRQFEQVLEMVRGVRALGMEACVTAGMLDREQADQLKQAGLTAYNHNIDTSREHYDKVITTREAMEAATAAS